MFCSIRVRILGISHGSQSKARDWSIDNQSCAFWMRDKELWQPGGAFATGRVDRHRYSQMLLTNDLELRARQSAEKQSAAFAVTGALC
jgi:hypothetical protein